jgi:hypothetical protein
MADVGVAGRAMVIRPDVEGLIIDGGGDDGLFDILAGGGR